MAFNNSIETLIKNKTVATNLYRGTRNKTAVKSLQSLLFELGFDKELNWVKYGADGDYGGSTTDAVKAFGAKNGVVTDGEQMTNDLAQKMLERYDIVDDMHHLYNAIKNNKLDQYARGVRNKTAGTVIQTLLNALGYQLSVDGIYGKGVTAAVQDFAHKAGINSDGTKVTTEIAQKILDKFTPYYGVDWNTGSKIETATKSLKINYITIRGKKKVVVSDDIMKVRFTRFRRGVYTYGAQQAIHYINANKDKLRNLGMTDSSMNVMVAVSENEGNLDAINTWDNSYMTFGMFQWTIGAGANKGELPALLKKIKKVAPDLFHTYYGQYGLDVSSDTGNVYGYFTLNGKKVRSTAAKEKIRSNEWSFYLWKSGQDDIIKGVEIEHALSRLKTFYWSERYRINGHLIADIVTSEYGVGLILDNHVNRPGYVKPCLVKAMNQTGLGDPENWSTAEERKLIEAYLRIRATHGRSPMTHANNRAKVTKKYLINGLISDERGSFIYDESLKGRGGDNTVHIGIAPEDFVEEDYPPITDFENEA